MGSISSLLDLWGLRLRRGRPGFCREACHVETPEEYLPELKDPAKGLEFRRGQVRPCRDRTEFMKTSFGGQGMGVCENEEPDMIRTRKNKVLYCTRTLHPI